MMQCFSAANVYMNHLRILSKWGFLLSRSELWSNLHFEQIPARDPWFTLWVVRECSGGGEMM